MAIEKKIRDAWQSFCEAGREGVAAGYVVMPGSSLADAVVVSSTAAVKSETPKQAETPKKSPFSKEKKDASN